MSSHILKDQLVSRKIYNQAQLLNILHTCTGSAILHRQGGYQLLMFLSYAWLGVLFTKPSDNHTRTDNYNHDHDIIVNNKACVKVDSH